MERLQYASVSGLRLSGRCVALIVCTELSAHMLVAADSLPSEQLLLRAIFTLILAVLLLPHGERSQPPSVGMLLSWSALSGISFVPGVVWVLGISPTASVIPPLAAGTAVLVLLFSSMTMSLAYYLNDRRAGSRITLAGLLFSLTLPLWASPIASLNGGSKWLVDAIVGLCPASYLAGLTQIDYLRGNWLYQHTPYGSLRFDYPDPVYTTVILLLLAVLMTTLGIVRWPFHINRAAPESLETNL